MGQTDSMHANKQQRQSMILVPMDTPGIARVRPFLALNAAWKMDTVGNSVAQQEVAMAKVAAPNMACQLIDWAIQAHGAAGLADDFPLARAYADARTLRQADGPDEVHRNQIARHELDRDRVSA